MSYAVHVTFLVAVAWSSFCNMLSTSGFGIGDAKECILKVTHQRQHRTGAASYSTIAFVFLFCRTIRTLVGVLTVESERV